jgi:hypothetical protein
MLGEAVACGAIQKYISNRPLSSYKRSLLITFKGSIHILEKKKKGYTHSISF